MTTIQADPKNVEMKISTKPKTISLGKSMLAACISAQTAEFMTMPLDTVKVRMQLFPWKYNGMIDCFKQTYTNEGGWAFFRGLQAGLMRHFVFSSLRVGLFDYGYQHLIDKKGESKITLLDRIYLGMASGAFGIAVANPTDVVKVRFQADMATPGISHTPRYRNIFHAFQTIFQEEGIRGFYQSLGPNILRNATMSTAEQASYTQIKFMFTIGNGKYGLFDEGIKLHLFSSGITGIIAIAIASPFDVTKNRITDGRLINGKKVPYNSIFECIKMNMAENGIAGFYKGFGPNCGRSVVFNVVMFVFREQILKYFRGEF